MRVGNWECLTEQNRPEFGPGFKFVCQNKTKDAKIIFNSMADKVIMRVIRGPMLMASVQRGTDSIVVEFGEG